MNNINIDFDELFEDLKAHNYYDSYKREIVKNALIEYARENDLTEFSLGATVECGCIEFDTKTQKSKFVVVCQPRIMALYSSCLAELDRRIAGEIFKENDKFSFGNMDYRTADAAKITAEKKFNEKGFVFRVPAIKTSKNNYSGLNSVYNDYHVAMQKYKYYSLFKFSKDGKLGKKFTKKDPNYDEYGNPIMDQEIREDIFGQALLQGYTPYELNVYDENFEEEQLLRCFFKRISNFLFDYSYMTMHFDRTDKNNLAGYFYNHAIYQPKKFNDADEKVREIMYALFQDQMFAPQVCATPVENATQEQEETDFLEKSKTNKNKPDDDEFEEYEDDEDDDDDSSTDDEFEEYEDDDEDDDSSTDDEFEEYEDDEDSTDEKEDEGEYFSIWDDDEKEGFSLD